MYTPPFPPDGFKTIVPSVKVLQVISVIVGLNTISEGSVITAKSCTGHQFTVTITGYVPGARFAILSAFEPLSQRKFAELAGAVNTIL